MKKRIATAALGVFVLVGPSVQASADVESSGDARHGIVNSGPASARKTVGVKLHYRCKTAYRPKRHRYQFSFKFRVPRVAKHGQRVRLRGIRLAVKIRRAYARMGIRHNMGKLVLVPGMVHGWSRISVGSHGKRRTYTVHYRGDTLNPRWFKPNVMHFGAGRTRSRIRMPRRGRVAILRAPRRFDLYGAWTEDSLEAFECRAARNEDRVIGLIKLR